MNLIVPPEPVDFKAEAKRQKARESWNIDSLVVWVGNSLPKYLWGYWRDALKKDGYTWQQFLRILSFHRKDIILWLRDEMSWEELIKKVKDSIEGTIGKLVRGTSLK